MSDGIAVGGQIVGVDLHLHRSVISRIDGRGREVETVRIDNDRAALVSEVGKAGAGAQVAIEATYGWYWAVDALRAAGFDVHMAHPYGLKAMRRRKRVKTDRADALELARLLRLGSLPEAFIAPPELRELRELVRQRQRLVETSTAVRAGIRALLAKHGIRLSATQLDGDAATVFLDGLSLPRTYATRLAAQRRLMLHLEEEIGAVEVELAQHLKDNSDYRNLMKIKGIGPILAAVFVAEIGDAHRFRNAAALTCWAGLTPRQHQSDGKSRGGHISKEGSKLVRWAAVEAVSHPAEPVVLQIRDAIIERRGKTVRSIAKVAAARRMLEVVYYVLRDGEARCLTPTAACT